MKAFVRLGLLALAIEMAAARLSAQDVVNHLNDPIAKARLFEFSTTLSKYAVDAPRDAASSDFITTKHLQIGGPLVHPLKSKKLSDVPGRLWHLINPFAKTEPKPSIEPVAGLSPRPWVSFADSRLNGSIASGPLTHESSFGLITVNRR